MPIAFFNDEFSHTDFNNHVNEFFRETDVLGQHVPYRASSPGGSVVGAFADPVLEILKNEITFPGKVRNVSEFHSQSSPHRAKFVKSSAFGWSPEKPESHELATVSQGQDFQTTLDLVKTLLTDWDFSKYQGSHAAFNQFLAHQGAVHHLTWKGRVLLHAQEYFPVQESNLDLWDGPAYETIKFSFNDETLPNGTPYYNVGYAVGSDSNTDLFKGSRKSFQHQLQWLRDSYLNGVTSTTGSTTHVLDQLDWSAGAEGDLRRITYRTHSIYNPWFTPHQTRFSFYVQLVFSEHTLRNQWFLDPTEHQLKYMAGCYMRVTTTVTEEGRTYNGAEWGPWQSQDIFFSGGQASSSAVWACYPCFWASYSNVGSSQLGFSRLRNQSVANGTYSPFTEDYMLEDFRARTAGMLDDLRSLLVLASHEALDDIQGKMDANNLENFTQISGLLDFLSVPGTAFQLYRKIRNGDCWGAGVTLLDLLADAKIAWDYGLAPTISDAKEIAKKAKPLVEAYKSGEWRKSLTSHGNASFTIPCRGSIGPIKVRAHVGLTARYSDSTLLALMLPIEAAGLFPWLSNMWDILPYSWFVDWFANIGTRVKTVESQFKVLAMDVLGVTCSISCETEISNDLLDQVGLSSLDPVNPRIREYWRWAQPTLPSPHHTIYDFQPAGGIPDVGLGLALLWKQLPNL